MIAKWMLAMTLAFLTLAGDVAGKWDFVLDTEGGERRASPTFQVDGKTVTGKWDTSEVKGTYEDGKLELEFPFVATEDNMTGTLKISGTVEGEKMTGKWEFEGYSGTFVATKAKT